MKPGMLVRVNNKIAVSSLWGWPSLETRGTEDLLLTFIENTVGLVVAVTSDAASHWGMPRWVLVLTELSFCWVNIKDVMEAR